MQPVDREILRFILAQHQPGYYSVALFRLQTEVNFAPIDLPKLLRHLEYEYIDAAMLATHSSPMLAAKLLNIHRSRIYRRLASPDKGDGRTSSARRGRER